MPIEIPLFLVPACAGGGTITPEWLECKRAEQRWSKFGARLHDLGKDAAVKLKGDIEARKEFLADLNRTQRAVNNATEALEKYKDKRNLPTWRKSIEGMNGKLQEFRQWYFFHFPEEKSKE
ncbi:hypothetical protein P280DRAFT_515265 [Massarina eburnea CBS 473.64]|uniref:Uncharacterized protein n=1 Tax=Massarina eburnea CBS 473.64 TaxID=1395130 RepID=A0A6A6SBV4_9PLEO|nr:hypothetical protein P280DRAFT_515265 [Massarina eburnea CBS 473.64]